MLGYDQTYFSQFKTAHMKKLAFLLPFAVSTLFTMAQSKEVFREGAVDPTFTTIVGLAKDTNPETYDIPASRVYPPAASSVAFLSEVAMFCQSEEERYFTPTSVVGTVAKLHTEQALSRRKPNFFMVEISEKKKEKDVALVMVLFDNRDDRWTYQTLSPDDLINLPSGAVLYHAL